MPEYFLFSAHFAQTVNVERRTRIAFDIRFVLGAVENQIRRERHERDLARSANRREVCRAGNVLAHAAIDLALGVVNAHVAGSINDGPRFETFDRGFDGFGLRDVELAPWQKVV